MSISSNSEMADTMANRAARSSPIRCVGYGWIMKNRCFLRKVASLLSAGVLSFGAPWTFGQDMSLGDIVHPDEEWQLMAEGYQFTDAACADAEGNFYFADVAKGTAINKISQDGKLSVFLENTPK